MQGPRDDPEPTMVNVFEVLKQAAAGAAFWNDSSVAACAGDIRRVMDGALARERWALMKHERVWRGACAVGTHGESSRSRCWAGTFTLHLGDYDQCLRARSPVLFAEPLLPGAPPSASASPRACLPRATLRSLDALLANGSAGVGVCACPPTRSQAAAEPLRLPPSPRRLRWLLHSVLGSGRVLVQVGSAAGCAERTGLVPADAQWERVPVQGGGAAGRAERPGLVPADVQLCLSCSGAGAVQGGSAAGLAERPGLVSSDAQLCLEVGVCLCRLVVLLAVLNALGWFLLTYEGVRRRLPVGWQPSPETANAMSPVAAWRKISGASDPRPCLKRHSPGAGGARGGDTKGNGDGSRNYSGSGASREVQAVKRVGAKDPGDWSWALSRMSALGGLRTLSMVSVVISHREWLMRNLPLLNKRDLSQRLLGWLHVYFPLSFLAVDTFLFVAGCVLAYSFACTRRRQPRSLRQLRSWLPAFYLHRYIRKYLFDFITFSHRDSIIIHNNTIYHIIKYIKKNVMYPKE
ncbi:Protein of unknown function [Gryllus bimaculatus]|nr:Protein of unknown function [Gryllus bimaculatus]